MWANVYQQPIGGFSERGSGPMLEIEDFSATFFKASYRLLSQITRKYV